MGVGGEGEEHHQVGCDDEEQAPHDGAFAQAGGAVLQLEEPAAPLDEAVDGPAGQAEQAQLLGRWRVDSQAVGVVGVALRVADLVGVAVPPHRALPQQPVGCRPCPREQRCRPPPVGDEEQHGRHAADEIDEAAGDEVDVEVHGRPGHPRVELAGHGEIARQLGILQVAEAGGAGARDGEAIEQPGRHPAPQVGAHGLVHGREHLEQHEADTDEGDGAGDGVVVLDLTDQHPHGDGEHRREHAAQQEDHPPRGREGRVGPGQRGEELPLLAVPQAPPALGGQVDPRSLGRVWFVCVQRRKQVGGGCVKRDPRVVVGSPMG